MCVSIVLVPGGHWCRLLIPESPRWLAVHGHDEAVLKLIRKICRINGRQLPEDFNPSFFVEDVSNLCRIIIASACPTVISGWYIWEAGGEISSLLVFPSDWFLGRGVHCWGSLRSLSVRRSLWFNWIVQQILAPSWLVFWNVKNVA